MKKVWLGIALVFAVTGLAVQRDWVRVKDRGALVVKSEQAVAPDTATCVFDNAFERGGIQTMVATSPPQETGELTSGLVTAILPEQTKMTNPSMATHNTALTTTGPPTDMIRAFQKRQDAPMPTVWGTTGKRIYYAKAFGTVCQQAAFTATSPPLIC